MGSICSQSQFFDCCINTVTPRAQYRFPFLIPDFHPSLLQIVGVKAAVFHTLALSG
jgi:hypothetical protein